MVITIYNLAICLIENNACNSGISETIVDHHGFSKLADVHEAGVRN